MRFGEAKMMRLITNRDPISDEFFLRDGNVYFCGLYENTLLKAVDSKEFLCWHYWGKSPSGCFMGGVRLRGADPKSRKSRDRMCIKTRRSRICTAYDCFSQTFIESRLATLSGSA